MTKTFCANDINKNYENTLNRICDRLKEAGTYDQTTVIMTADHGFNQRFYPVFLVKEANRSEEGFGCWK